MGGKDGEGSNRDGNRVAIERGQWRRGEDGKGAMGRVEMGKRWGRAKKKGQEISQMDMMGCLGGHRL